MKITWEVRDKHSNVNKSALNTILDDRLDHLPTIKSNKQMIIKRTSKIAITIATNKRAFKNWWGGVCDDPLTRSAANYCKDPIFTKEGVIVIKTIDDDAVDVMDRICNYS